MKKMWKSVLSFVLVAAVSAGVSVGTYSYLDQNKKVATTSTTGFQQPLKLATYNAAAAENTDFTKAAENAVHGVVHIKATTEVKDQGGRQPQYIDPFEFFFGDRGGFQRPQAQPRVGFGSGVIISTDGYIITNNHVIDGATTLDITLNDGRQFKGKLVGADEFTDIALVKIDAEDLPVIPFGDSEKLKVGEWVLAVGNPFNLTSTVTAGIVSAKGRGISGMQRNGGMKIESFIQTDAAVNPGNSGGALINTKGELIGINTAIYSETGNYAGYSFAVPISIAGKVANDLKQYGAVQRAMLGVTIRDVSNLTDEEKSEGKIKVYEGAYVNDFADFSSAKEAGLEVGDVITHVNGVKIKNTNELQEQVSKYRPGDNCEITVDRQGKTKNFTVKFRNRQGNTEIMKGDAGSSVLGATFKELTKEQKRAYGVNYGIMVESVSNGKFKDAGIKKGFVIMVVNDTRVTSPDDLDRMVKDIMAGNSEHQGLFIKGFYKTDRGQAIKYYAINLL